MTDSIRIKCTFIAYDLTCTSAHASLQIFNTGKGHSYWMHSYTKITHHASTVCGWCDYNNTNLYYDNCWHNRELRLLPDSREEQTYRLIWRGRDIWIGTSTHTTAPNTIQTLRNKHSPSATPPPPVTMCPSNSRYMQLSNTQTYPNLVLLVYVLKSSIEDK